MGGGGRPLSPSLPEGRSERRYGSCLEELADRLAAVSGVVAVTLGGSRAAAARLEGDERDFRLYYRERLAVAEIRALGLEGEVSEPGAWGRLANGGGRLRANGRPVLLLYRDLDAVERWTQEAEAGRYEVDNAVGYVAGMASYALAGELAVADVLSGELPRPEFPQALRESAPRRWRTTAALSLDAAEAVAARGDVVACTGLLAMAAIAAAQGSLAQRGEWATSERGIVRRAGIERAEAVLAAIGERSSDLERAIARLRVTLNAGGAATPRG